MQPYMFMNSPWETVPCPYAKLGTSRTSIPRTHSHLRSPPYTIAAALDSPRTVQVGQDARNFFKFRCHARGTHHGDGGSGVACPCTGTALLEALDVHHFTTLQALGAEGVSLLDTVYDLINSREINDLF
jgi:hypothetical protein